MRSRALSSLLAALRPQRLRHQMLVLLIGGMLVSMATLYAVSSRRAADAALQTSSQWAGALARTAAGAAAPLLVKSDETGLEKALRANDRLGGHMVSGHVDGIGSVVLFEPVGESWELRISAPPSLARFLAYKGSITVNGVSLTVNRVVDQQDRCEFSINLIPHTIENTTLGTLRAGSRVNLEIDLIARYVERMLGGSLPRH